MGRVGQLEREQVLRKREKRGSRELKERPARKMAIAEKRAGGGERLEEKRRAPLWG